MDRLPGALMERIDQVRAAMPAGQAVYLVGGAVRDALLGRETHDLDFVLGEDVLEFARRTANALGGAYYPLDEARQTARVVLNAGTDRREILDFAAYRGPDLESDLSARDFTLNAMAIPLEGPLELIDPLHGAEDLLAKRMRACSPTSLTDDPLRVARAIRLANNLGLFILPETRKQVREAAPGLERVSPERKRDELFRILDGSDVSTAFRALDQMGVLGYLLPELVRLKGVAQTAPHIYDVWEHTLSVMQNLESVLGVLALSFQADRAASLVMGMLSHRLGRFRQEIHDHLGQRFTPDRNARALLFLAALYHDSGKPATRRVEPGGRVRFFGHEQAGDQIVHERAVRLRLSSDEVERVSAVVAHHLRPILLAQGPEPPSRRAVYRFYRDAGQAGVEVCLLSLADVLGTYGPAIQTEAWQGQLDTVRTLLEAWWEQRTERVLPDPLINGRELMRNLRLQSGPEVGRLLEAIREAQAAGEVRSREEALELARRMLDGGA